MCACIQAVQCRTQNSGQGADSRTGHKQNLMRSTNLLGGVPASLPPSDDAGECGRGLCGSAFLREFSRPKPPRPVDPASLYAGPGLAGCDCISTLLNLTELLDMLALGPAIDQHSCSSGPADCCCYAGLHSENVSLICVWNRTYNLLCFGEKHNG